MGLCKCLLHTVKRTSHILLNAYYLKSGDTLSYSDMSIYNLYPLLDKEVINKIKTIRTDWCSFNKRQDIIKPLINYFHDNNEYIYREVILYARNGF
jgi:hypothetical protein